MECTICKKEILGYDHNAQPVAKGRCCERCNHNVVIPTRIKHVMGIYKKAQNDIIND
jgi:hypothetical protein|eukprot:COSAG01_NODE_109_length_25925_cov_48.384961_10_plen_57_part_00